MVSHPRSYWPAPYSHWVPSDVHVALAAGRLAGHTGLHPPPLSAPLSARPPSPPPPSPPPLSPVRASRPPASPVPGPSANVPPPHPATSSSTITKPLEPIAHPP